MVIKQVLSWKGQLWIFSELAEHRGAAPFEDAANSRIVTQSVAPNHPAAMEPEATPWISAGLISQPGSAGVKSFKESQVVQEQRSKK